MPLFGPAVLAVVAVASAVSMMLQPRVPPHDSVEQADEPPKKKKKMPKRKNTGRTHRKGSDHNTRSAYTPVSPKEERPYAWDTQRHDQPSDFWVAEAVQAMLQLSPAEQASRIDELPGTQQDQLLEQLSPLLSQEQRRGMIAGYFVDVLDMPPEEDWDGYNGTVSIISDQLNIPQGRRAGAAPVARPAGRVHGAAPAPREHVADCVP